MKHHSTDHYRDQFTKELARLIGCKPESLPTTTPKIIGAQFLGLKNPKTLNVWHSAGRHGIVMVKIGRITEVSTEWLIDLKTESLSVSQEVA